MSAFTDLGRMVLEAVITADAGDLVEAVDVPRAVNAYVEKWGFADRDQVPDEDYWLLLRSCAEPPVR